MCQYTEAFGRISGLHAHYFVLALYLTVTCFMFGCCRYSALDSSGDDFTGCTKRVSTVDTCYAAVHLTLDEFPTISTSTWTRNLRCFFSVLTQNGEVCSVFASGYFELHVAGSSHDDEKGVGATVMWTYTR